MNSNLDSNPADNLEKAFARFELAFKEAITEKEGPLIGDNLKYPFLFSAMEAKKDEHRWFFENSPFKNNERIQDALSELLEVSSYDDLNQRHAESEIRPFTKSIFLAPFANNILSQLHLLGWVSQHGSADNIAKLQRKIIEEKPSLSAVEVLACHDKSMVLNLLKHLPLSDFSSDSLKFIQDHEILSALINSKPFKKMPGSNTGTPVREYMESLHDQYSRKHDSHSMYYNPKQNLGVEDLGEKTMSNLCVAAHYLLKKTSEKNEETLAECLPLIYWAGPLEKVLDLFETIDFSIEQLELIAQTLYRHSYGLDEPSHFKEKAQYLQERIQEATLGNSPARKYTTEHSEIHLVVAALEANGSWKLNKHLAPDNLTQACLAFAQLSDRPITEIETLAPVASFLDHQWAFLKSVLIGTGHVPRRVTQMEDLFEKTPFYLPWLKDVFQHSLAQAHLLNEAEQKALVPLAGLVAFYRPDYVQPITEPVRLLLSESGELRDALELALMASTLCTHSFCAGLPIKQRNNLMHNYDVSVMLENDKEKDQYNPYLLMTQDLLKTIKLPQFQKWLPSLQKNFVLYSDSRLSLLNEICYKTYIKPVNEKAYVKKPHPDRF